MKQTNTTKPMTRVMLMQELDKVRDLCVSCEQYDILSSATIDQILSLVDQFGKEQYRKGLVEAASKNWGTQRKYQEGNVAKGLCRTCAKPVWGKGRSYCQTHREYNILYGREYQRRKRLQRLLGKEVMRHGTKHK